MCIKRGTEMIQKQTIGRNGVLKLLAAVVLSAVIGMSIIPEMGMVSTVHAEGVKTITGLGTGTIGNPNKPASGSIKWSGSYVYYGKYKNNPVKYRVLSKKTTDFGGSTMLLDCDSILEQMSFDSDAQTNQGAEKENEWALSDIRAWLNGSSFLGSTSVFSTVEKEAIVKSTAERHVFAEYVKEPVRGSLGNRDGEKKYFTALVQDEIFLLDVEDVLNEDYGYSDDNGWSISKPWTHHGVENHKKSVASSVASLEADSRWWWLRSPASEDDNYAGVVTGDVTGGYVNTDNVDDPCGGVSPAFNVNLSSVIFSSLISSESSSYKLTLKDGTLGATPGTITRDGKTVTVPYSDVKGSSAQLQLSVVMTNGTWSDMTGWSSGAEKKYYGKLNISGGIGTSGSGTFDLPDGFSYSNGWKAYLVAEQVNGEKETDYAGAPVEFTIPKLDPVCNAPIGLTATYGQTLANVTLTNPTGNTDGKWAWANSTQSVGDVGEHTFKANFTPTDTTTYNSKRNVDVTVKVGKANAVAATVTANNRTYDGAEKPLVNVDNSTLVGGTMQYALGNANGAVGPYTPSIPAAADAGTYYVWYMTKGDANHADSVSSSVAVEIAKKSEPEEKVTIMKVPAKIKAKAWKNKVTVSWKKVRKTKKTKALLAQIQGIELQYSPDPSFPVENSVKIPLSKKKTKYVLKGLQRKSIYYVRVRYADGAGGYSAWSKVKKVKTK